MTRDTMRATYPTEIKLEQKEREGKEKGRQGQREARNGEKKERRENFYLLSTIYGDRVVGFRQTKN